MDERRTARIVGLTLGAIFAAVLVLNAFAGG
jgi:tetrahydromethanopterin S-methyltransferase subunit F